MTGITESFAITGTKGITAQVTVMEEYDLTENKSQISVAVAVASSVYSGHIYYLDGAVAAAGQTLQSMNAFLGTHYVYVQQTNTPYEICAADDEHTGSPWILGDIVHETDGSKTITVSITLTGEEESGRGADGWTLTGSREIPLTHIPRASTVAATDAAIGAVSMVAVNRKSADYTHSLYYRFGDLSGYITPEGLAEEENRFADTAVAFAIPTAFYSRIPQSKSGSCTLICKTYHGDTQIGEDQSCTFTVHTDETLCTPSLSATVSDGNSTTAALTGDRQMLVRYASNAVCSVSAAAKNGASLEEITANGVVLSQGLYTFQAVERGTFTFTARDSRGYTASLTRQHALIPYVRLTCNPTAKRTDPTSGNAVLTVTGDCYDGSFGAKRNTLQLHYRIGSGEWVAMGTTFDGNTYTAQAELTGLSYTASHAIQVRAVDKLQQVTKSVSLGKGIPVFDWGENDFVFHVPVLLAGLPESANEAASKGYADRKLSIVKLWENPAPSEAFPAQTVEVSLAGCSFLFCTAVAKAGERNYQISAIVENTLGNTGCINSFASDGTDFWLNERTFTLSYNGVSFGPANMRDMKNDTVYADWRARTVPMAIYGIRGTVG